METYSLHEIATLIGKNKNVVNLWFNQLEDKYNYYIHEENKDKIFTERDLSIAKFIAEKKNEKWSYNIIFKQLEEMYHFETKQDLHDSIENTSNNYLLNIGQDPENLFYEIAQDNEVIRIFKYHSLRVMFLASGLAKRVNCYDENLRLAALLHDIGKVGISKKILLKQDKLTDLEYTIIQSHSHMGNVIVRKHLGLTKTAQYIRDHHERWDGTGYPRRLIGDEISIQGRIISICDSFDTMTVDRRIYRKTPLSYKEALKELKRCAWTQFDGNLVQTFIDMMEEIKIPEYMLPKESENRT